MGYIFEALERAGNDRSQSETAHLAAENRAAQVDTRVPETDATPANGPAQIALKPLQARRTLPLDPAHMKKLDDRLVTLLQPGSPMAEEYRAIRTSLLARWQHARQLAHTITSATPAEGKTITSLNLGLCFAELRNRRTVVVEADLRLPTFGKLLGLKDDSEPGLAAYLRGDAELHEIVTELGKDGLGVITAGGRANEQAVQLLSGKRMTDLLVGLRERFDHVIIDTPPVLELADAGIVGAISDEVLLVARMGWTPRSLMHEAVRSLTSYNAKVAGMIATDQRRTRGQYYSRYGYHYGYYQQQRRR